MHGAEMGYLESDYGAYKLLAVNLPKFFILVPDPLFLSFLPSLSSKSFLLKFSREKSSVSPALFEFIFLI